MGNKITEKYFSYKYNGSRDYLAEICGKTGFMMEKEIFRSVIYDREKVGAIIYEGIIDGRTSILKIQLLQPEIDEIKLMDGFNKQNQSAKIRIPELYQGQAWSEKRGYGFLVLENIKGRPIYENPLANDKEMIKFCRFYEEFKVKAVTKPFFTPGEEEKDSLLMTKMRVEIWGRIAESKAQFDDESGDYLERYLDIIEYGLNNIKTEFMHGHLAPADIFETGPDRYVLMSNLFWTYRPQYYDTTFHIWAGIKSIRDLAYPPAKALEYIEKWRSHFKRLPTIADDPGFDRRFNLMLLERCLGAILVDLRNQHYENKREEHIAHLNLIFKEIFNKYAE